MFQHVFFETSVNLSNYYIEHVLLVFCIFFLLYSWSLSYSYFYKSNILVMHALWLVSRHDLNTLEVIIHLIVQKNKWLIQKKAKLNAVKAFSESIFAKSSRHFKNLMYATLNSLILFNQLITDILKLILMMMMSTMQTENQ